jgi:hypothetical protein
VKTALKLILLVVMLNLIRHLVGGPIEAFTIMEPMHRVMPEYPTCFNNQFTGWDWASSFFYNFMLWFSITWIFHIAHPALSGSWVVRSLKVFGLGCLFFISLAAVYMNHYVPDIRTFYQYSMLDALILFPLLGVANGLLYPWIFGRGSSKLL